MRPADRFPGPISGERRRRLALCIATSLVAVLVTMTWAGVAVAHRTSVEFSSHAHISCAVYDGHTGPAEALCEDSVPGRVAHVTLTPDGTILTCLSSNVRTNSCELGNAGERTPTFGYGHVVTVGRFRCTILHTGVRCVVTATGKGFLFSATRTSAVGGATVRVAPLHLSGFLSPDKKVWCGIGTSAVSCGTYPEPPTRSGEVNAAGHVTICSVLHLEYPNGAHAPVGCYQNWDTSLPILQYGQETELEGFRCSSASDGITCVTVAGAGAGKGFRVSSTEAVEVG